MRVVRLIAWCVLFVELIFLTLPLARADTTLGSNPLPTLYKMCDVGGAGSGAIAVGHSALTNFCVDSPPIQSGANMICTKHGASYGPPGTYSTKAARADFPSGIGEIWVTCAVKPTNPTTWNGIHFRLCPSTTVPGAYETTWRSSLNAPAGPCPSPPPPPNPCTSKEGQTALPLAYYSIGADPSTPPEATACVQQCVAIFSGESPAGRRLSSAGGYEYFAHGSYKWTALECTAGDAPTGTSGIPPDSCPPGKVLGVDPATGKNACLNPETGEPEDPNPEQCPAWCGCGTKTTTNPDGSVDTVVTEWDGGAGVCSKKTYHDPDGSGPLPGGPGSGQPPTEEEEESKPDEDPPGAPNPDPMDELCEKNPELEMCKTTSFGGACGGAFTCEGDAVQCAIAKAVNEVNCAFKPQSTTINDIVEAQGLTGKEAALTASLVPSTVDVAGMLHTNERDLAGSCPAPFQFTAMGGSFGIDVGPLCDLAEIAGALLMISAALIAARIIAGGV